MTRCLNCYSSFAAHRSDTLFCTTRCRVAYHRAKQSSIECENTPNGKIILSLCDYTGNWSRPYEEAGYTISRIDLKHGQDVRFLTFPAQQIYGILAAPPCTVFANSGNAWKRTDAEMLAALSIVDACLRLVAMTNPHFWVLENPVGTLGRYCCPACRFPSH